MSSSSSLDSIQLNIGFIDNSDASKIIAFDFSNASPNTTTTFDLNQTENRTLSIPNASTSLVGTDTTDALTNKTLVEIDNIRLDGNTISSLNSNGNINLNPNGSGKIVTNNEVNIGNIGINNNEISSLNSNGNIIFTPNSDGHVIISSNLEVLGNTTSVDSTTFNIADTYLYSNKGYTTNAAKTTGWVSNYFPTATSTTVSSSGFGTTTSVNVASTTGFASGDIIQISSANSIANEGIFQIDSVSSNVITITAAGEDFVQSEFLVDNSDTAADIFKVNVSVIRTADGSGSTSAGNFEIGKGSSSPFTFSTILTSSDLIVYSTNVQSSDKGDLLVGNATNGTFDILSIGSVDQVLTVSSDSNLLWKTPTSDTTTSVNVGSSGVNVFASDNNGELQFRKLDSSDNSILFSVSPSDQIDLSLNVSNLQSFSTDIRSSDKSDLLVGNATNTFDILAIGIVDDVLTVSSDNNVVWANYPVSLESTGTGTSLVNDGTGPSLSITSLTTDGDNLNVTSTSTEVDFQLNNQLKVGVGNTTGMTANGSSSFIFGEIENGGVITAQKAASFVSGYATDNSRIDNYGIGCQIFGAATSDSDIVMASDVYGSMIISYATESGLVQNFQNGSLVLGECSQNGIIENEAGSNYLGNFTFGRCDNGGVIRTGNRGNLTFGESTNGNIINRGSAGCLLFGQCDTSGTLENEAGTDRYGNLTFGRVAGGLISGRGSGSLTFGSTAGANPGSIINNGNGSLLFGYCEGTSSVFTSNDDGNLTFGRADAANSTLTNNGKGSIACGSVQGGSIINNADASFVMSYNISNSDFSETAGSGSFAIGRSVRTSQDYSVLIGRYGVQKSSPGSLFGEGSLQIAGGADNSSTDGISVAIGTSTFGNNPTGGGYADVWSTSGADYAEYFEWNDGNVNDEDRIGYFVQLNYDKIEIANTSSDVIGVTSSIKGSSAFIGDNGELRWHGAIQKDEFGRPITKLCYKRKIQDLLSLNKIVIDDYLTNNFDNSSDCQELIDVVKNHNVVSTNSDFNEVEFFNKLDNITPDKVTIDSSDFDGSFNYIPRSSRKEWYPVGLMGKLFVRDDGTCVPGSKCTCTSGGIATSGNDWSILKRQSSDVIQILLN